MKIVIGLLAAAILGTGGFAFAAGVDDTQPARTVSLPGTTTGTTTAATTAVTTTDDIVVGNAPATTTTTTTNGEDISGPCDEAEHANDLRCTGGAADDGDNDDDNSGPGSGDDNSGHGSGHDNSGHGSGHDSNDD